MLIFDLTQYNVFSFPISNKDISYDDKGDIFWCKNYSTIKKVPTDLFLIMLKEKMFYVLMSNEKSTGYRKYKCEIIECSLTNRNIKFLFQKIDFEKNEIRKLKIKNLLNTI